MEVFHAQNRSTPILFAVLFAVFSGIVFGVGVLPAWRDEVPGQSASGNALQFWVSSGIAGIMLLLSLTSLRLVCVIEVEDDGTIALVRLLGSSRIAARDIRHLEGHFEPTYEGDQLWHMDLWIGRRHLRFDQFPRVIDFVATIEALNPGVLITGIWPFPPPEDPWPGRRSRPDS